jgi:hypothetical protein
MTAGAGMRGQMVLHGKRTIPMPDLLLLVFAAIFWLASRHGWVGSQTDSARYVISGVATGI